jgi:hypothetical protein
MGKNTFIEHRPERSSGYDSRGWFIVSGHDERGYAVMVQQCRDERQPMVRVGCRYKSLKEIRAYYVSRSRNNSETDRRTAQQILSLIKIAVETVTYKGWLERKIKFNATPRKVSR